MKEEKKYTVDDDTVASNPGNVILKPLVWIKYNILQTSILTISLLLSIYFSIFISYGFIVFVILTFAINFFYWKRKKEHFKYGDSNGGLIISLKPKLIAVTTDLTKGFNGEYPVIKIIKHKMDGKIGDRIGTVALYSESENEKIMHWIDFNPIPINYATNNNTEIKSAISSYGTEQWKQINERLEQVPRPYKEGLFKITGKNSDWKTKTSSKTM